MKMFALAAALAVALPAAAHAADAPAASQAPSKEHHCCCCEEMIRDHGGHAKMMHDMSGDEGHDMNAHHPMQPQG